jgi:hypothetical protein
MPPRAAPCRCADARRTGVARRPERCHAASTPVILFVPARCRIPAPCPAGISVLSQQHGPKLCEIRAVSRSPGRRPPCFCRLRLHVRPPAPRPSRIPAAPCCPGRARPTLAPATPGRAVRLVQAGISAASPGPVSLRPAIADIAAPDVLD